VQGGDERLHQVADDNLVLLGEGGAKALVNGVDELRQWRHGISDGDKVVLEALRIQLPQTAFEPNRAPSPIHSQRTSVQRPLAALYGGSTRRSSSPAHWPQGICVAHPPVDMLKRPQALMSQGRKSPNTARMKSTNLSYSAFHAAALLAPESHAWILGVLFDRSTYGKSAKIYCRGVPPSHESSTRSKSLGLTEKRLLLDLKTLRRS
jgi:hypothetical protein